MKYTFEDLNEKTVVELREICKDLGITGMSKQRKEFIVDEIITIQDSTSKPEAIKGQFKTTIDEDGNEETKVKVSCGASSDKFSVCGKTVGAVAELLREVLNVDRMSVGIVNGEEVEDSYILEAGDSLEFLKPTGGKGMARTPEQQAAFKQKMKEAHNRDDVKAKHKQAAIDSWKDPVKKEARKLAMKAARAAKKAAPAPETPAA
jgi:hypothetical protein